MKKIDFGRTIQVLANVGVIAGIVFLGIEMRQNNDLLRLEAETSGLERNAATLELLMANPDLLSATMKDPGDLSALEVRQIDLLVQRMLTAWQAAYRNFGRGALDEMPTANFACVWNSDLKHHFEMRWPRAKRGMDPAFVAYMEQNVVKGSCE